jgi:uncharacterized protein YjiS (DUF1127 family)
MSHFANPNQSGRSLSETLSDVVAVLWTSKREEKKLEARLAQKRKLEAKSDDELAQLGITRDRIAHYVYRDIYYV